MWPRICILLSREARNPHGSAPLFRSAPARRLETCAHRARILQPENLICSIAGGGLEVQEIVPDPELKYPEYSCQETTSSSPEAPITRSYGSSGWGNASRTGPGCEPKK